MIINCIQVSNNEENAIILLFDFFLSRKVEERIFKVHPSNWLTKKLVSYRDKKNKRKKS
jgi:hypothetical protein